MDGDRASWGCLIEAYVTHLTAAGRSSGTVRLHRHYLAQLRNGFPTPQSITIEDLERFLSSRAWSAETRKSARTVCRGFFGWAHRTGRLRSDPSRGLPAVRVPEAAARPAPESVLCAALRGAAERERLMVMLAALLGMRCAEIARVHACDLVGDLLRVHGKGAKVREVPVVHSELLFRLRQVEGWAFPNGRGSHLSPGHVSRLLSRTLAGAWTGHTLRHRAGTVAYAGTRDLLAVMAMLGHCRPETTRRYIRLPDDAVRAALAAAAA